MTFLIQSQHPADNHRHCPTKDLLDAATPENRENIIKDLGDSLRDRRLPAAVLHDVDIQLMAMIHGDKIISKSDLDGPGFCKNLSFVLKILESKALDEDGQISNELTKLSNLTHGGFFQKNIHDILEKYNKEKKVQDTLLKELTDLYAQAQTIDNIASSPTEEKCENLLKNTISSIQSLDHEQTFLFYGGWHTSNGGHAIIYEVKKNKDDTYNFTFINAGSGLSYHQTAQLPKHDYKNSTISVINISKEKMCSREFWSAVIDLLCNTYKGIEEQSVDDIYTKLIVLLDSEVKYVIDLDGSFINEQFSGTCTWKSIMALLKYRLGKENGRKIICAIKFYSIANYIRLHSQITTHTEKVLLEKAIQGLNNLASKIHFPVEEHPDWQLHIHALSEKVKNQIAEWNKKEENKKYVKGNTSPVVLKPENLLHSSPQLDKEVESKKIPESTSSTIELPRPRLFDGEFLSLQMKIASIPILDENDSSSLDVLKSKFNEYVGYAFSYLKQYSENTLIYVQPSRVFIDFCYLYIVLGSLTEKIFKIEHDIDFTQYSLPIPFYKELFSKSLKPQTLPFFNDYDLHERVKKLQTYFLKKNNLSNDNLFDYPFEQNYIKLEESTSNSFCTDFKFLKMILEKKGVSNNDESLLFTLAKYFTTENLAPIPTEYYQLRKIWLLCRASAMNFFRGYDKWHIQFPNFRITSEQFSSNSKSVTIGLEHSKGDRCCLGDLSKSYENEWKNPLYNLVTPLPDDLTFSKLDPNLVRTKPLNSLPEISSVERLIDILEETRFRLVYLYNFYIENPKILSEDRHYYFFWNAMFKLHVFMNSFKEIEEFGQKTFHFFSTALNKLGQDNKNEKPAIQNLLRIGLSCSKLIHSDDPVFKDLLPLSEFLHNKSKDILTKEEGTDSFNDFFQIFCISLSIKKVISEDDIIFFFDAVKKAIKYKLPLFWMVRDTFLLTENLKGVLSDKAKRLQYFPPLPCFYENEESLDWEGEFPIYKRGEWIFDLSRGLLKHPKYKGRENFLNSSSNKRALLESNPNLSLESFSPNKDYYVNQDDTVRLFSYQNEIHTIHMKRDGKWYRFLGLCVDPFSLLNAAFYEIRGNRWWECLKEDSKQIIAIGDDDQVKMTLEQVKHESEMRWKLSDLTKQTCFAEVDDASSLPAWLRFTKEYSVGGQAQFWVDKDNSIETICLPFSITLQRKKDGNFYIPELNDLILETGEVPSPFVSINPVYLRDRKGNLFLFIPNTEINFTKSKKTNDLLKHQLSFGEIGSYRTDPYFMCNYDAQSQNVLPNNTLAALQLVYMYLADQNIKKALEMIQFCTKTDPYDVEQRRIIFRIFDYSRNVTALHLGYAIYMHVLLLLARNNKYQILVKNHNDKEEIKLKESAEHVYSQYIKYLGAIPVEYLLSKEDELLVHKFINTTFFSVRREFLTGYSSENRYQKSSLMGNEYFLPQHLCIQDLSFETTLLPFEEIQEIKYEDFTDYIKTNKPILGSTRTKRPITFRDVIFLWMGFLSNNKDLNIAAAFQIIYFKFIRSDAASKVDLEVLKRILISGYVTRDKYREYLRKKYNDNFLAFPVEIVKEYNEFLKTLESGYYKHSTNGNVHKICCFKIGLQNIQESKSFDPHLFKLKKNMLPVLQDLPAENPNIRNIDPLLKPLNESTAFRKNLASQFFKQEPVPVDFPKEFIKAGSKFEQFINSSPIAKELFAQYLTFPKGKLKKWVLWDEAYIELMHRDVGVRKMAIQKETQDLKKEIGLLANRNPMMKDGTCSLQDLCGALEKEINIFAGNKRSISIEFLIQLILTNRWNSLHQFNPFINEEDRNKLLLKTLSWMALENESRLLEKIEKNLDKILQKQKANQKIEYYPIHKLVGLLQTERTYSIEKHPFVLVFEFLNKINLRPRQTEVLLEVLNSEKRHHLIKLMMGEGKTKVIIPLLALFFAQKSKVPFLIVPQEIFNQNLKELKETCEFVLGQKMFGFQFDRSSQSNDTFFNDIRNTFEEIQKQGGCIVTTMESTLALFVKYKEILVLTENQSWNEIRSSLEAVVNFIYQHCVAIIDEGHMALCSLREINFSFGNSEQINTEDCNTILELMKFLDEMKFDFSQPLIPKDNANKDPTYTKLRTQVIEHFFPKPEQEGLRSYLLGTNQEAIELIKQQDPALASKASLIKEEIWSLFPFTLSKGLDLHYGRSKNTSVESAIPYVGNRKPTLRSEFANHHVMLNYTIQMYLQKGLSNEQFKEWLEFVITLNRRNPEKVSKFIKLFGDQLPKEVSSLNEERLKQLQKLVGKQKEVIYNFLTDFLFPTFRIFKEKISGNAQDLADIMFTEVVTLSGTPYNKDTFPSVLSDVLCQPTEEEHELVEILLEPRNGKIDILDNGEPKEVIEKVKSFAQENPNTLALVDLGAYFRGLKNGKVAKMLLQALPHILGVVFFDDETNELVTLVKDTNVPSPYAKGKIPSNKLFAYYDNAHFFAADIPLFNQAEFVYTNAEDNCLMEMFQAWRRPRKPRSQTVRNLIKKSVAEKIRDLTACTSIQMTDLFHLGIYNQDALLTKELVVSSQQKMLHIPRKIHLDNQLKEGPESKALHSEHFIDKLSTDPYDIYRHFEGQVPTDTFLRNWSQQIIQSAEKIEKGRSDLVGYKSGLEKEHEKILVKAIAKLPPTVSGFISKDLNVDIQKRDKKIEVSTENFKEFSPFSQYTGGLFSKITSKDLITKAELRENWNCDYTHVFFSLNDIFSNLLPEYVEIFEPKIYSSINFIKTARVNKLSWDVPLKSVDAFMLRLCKIDNVWNFETALLTSRESRSFIDTYKKERDELVVTFFDLNGDKIYGDVIPADVNAEVKSFIGKVRLQLMFFNGIENYPTEMEEALGEWVKGKERLFSKLIYCLHKNRRKENRLGTGNFWGILEK